MITSISNPQMKNLVKLNTKSKARKEQQVFVVEGEKLVFEAPKDRIQKIYISEEYYNRKKLDHFEGQIPVEVVDNQVFKSVSDTVTPQGILAIISQRRVSLEEILKVKNPCILVLEDVQDPGNLGTIVRTAEAAGVTGIIMSQATADIYNPKTIRSTMGAIYRVPFLYERNLLQVAEKLHEQGISTYAAHLEGSVWYDTPSYIEGTAFLMGNEGNGLSKELSEKADKYIKIPMEGQAESLNVAVASSLLMYEAYRQRR